jgi:predicted PurR-regulated permease PerM
MTERIYLSSRARATIVWVAVAVTLLFVWEVRDILTPFIWAIITAYVLNPVVIFLARRTGWSRRMWAIVFYAGLLGLLVYGISSLFPLLREQVTDFANDLPRNVREAGRFLRDAGLVEGNTIDLLGTRINLNATDEEINQQLSALASQEIGRNLIPTLTHGFEGVLKLLVYLVATFFLLLEMDRIGQGVANLTPANVRSELGPWVRRINYVLGAYIRGQLILVVLMSTVTYIALTILEVRYAPLLAIFTGLVETIPFIGPYTAGATAVLVAVTQGSAPFGWTPIVLGIVVAITYTVLRQIEDNFVIPFLIGRLVHLHPLAVIFAVLAGAAIGGILGLLIAVPVAATVKVIAIYLYGKLREEPPRTLAVIEESDGWGEITARVREAALVSKANGAARPSLLISVLQPPPALDDPAEFHRLKALLDESHADALLLTPDAALLRMAAEAGIATEEHPQYVPVAPEPDFEEGRPTGPLLRRRSRSKEVGEPLRSGAAARARRRGFFSTRPLAPKEADEDRTV